MTDNEKKDLVINLTFEASKAVLSTVELEKQYKRRTGGGVDIDTYIPHVASVIVTDFVERTVKSLENRGLI